MADDRILSGAPPRQRWPDLVLTSAALVVAVAGVALDHFGPPKPALTAPPPAKEWLYGDLSRSAPSPPASKRGDVCVNEYRRTPDGPWLCWAWAAPEPE